MVDLELLQGESQGQDQRHQHGKEISGSIIILAAKDEDNLSRKSNPGCGKQRISPKASSQAIDIRRTATLAGYKIRSIHIP